MVDAVSWCIDNDIMVKYLRKHREEVADMWLTEFDEEEYREAMKKEIRDDTIVEHVEALVESTKWSVEDACKALKVTVEYYKKARENYENDFARMYEKN